MQEITGQPGYRSCLKTTGASGSAGELSSGRTTQQRTVTWLNNPPQERTRHSHRHPIPKVILCNRESNLYRLPSGSHTGHQTCSRTPSLPHTLRYQAPSAQRPLYTPLPSGLLFPREEPARQAAHHDTPSGESARIKVHHLWSIPEANEDTDDSLFSAETPQHPPRARGDTRRWPSPPRE